MPAGSELQYCVSSENVNMLYNKLVPSRVQIHGMKLFARITYHFITRVS